MVTPSLLRINLRKTKPPRHDIFFMAAIVVVGMTGFFSLNVMQSVDSGERATSASVMRYNTREKRGLWKKSRSLDMVRPQRAVVAHQPQYSGQDAFAPHYFGQDSFRQHQENGVKLTSEQPISTFSVDVDTASYGFVRRSINGDNLPPKDAVRIEEMINYFDYDYPVPKTKEVPFEATVALNPSPWGISNQKLIHIGIKGYDVNSADGNAAHPKPHSNLVFLIDTSGSMQSSDRLPLVMKSIEMLLSSLESDDRVAIATYDNVARVNLESTPIREMDTILTVLRSLRAGGGTGGAGGLKLAYELAEANFDNTENTVNRVILASDGDFNVGVTDEETLKQFIQSKRKTGIFLSVLGFGVGNYKDSRMQVLANYGNGIASYIDTINEAQKVLVEEASSTLFPIAKDVKIQVEFNPSTVAEYRLIGYEKRILNREDFNNDNVDAGEIGSGHTVTAIYEITPNDPHDQKRFVDERRYETSVTRSILEGGQKMTDELGFLKIRYKLPDHDESKLVSIPILRDSDVSTDVVAQEFGFATAVAGFAQLLRDGKHMDEKFGFDKVIEWAGKYKGVDEFGYRSEFIKLVRRASFIPRADLW